MGTCKLLVISSEPGFEHMLVQVISNKRFQLRKVHKCTCKRSSENSATEGSRTTYVLKVMYVLKYLPESGSTLVSG